jgi:hypothetical protein
LDSFSKAFESFYATVGVIGVLEVGKWTCLGAYLFLESLTIVSAFIYTFWGRLMEEQLDTMGVWPSTWAEACLLEGNKFWFYSLVCSILLGALQLSADGSGEKPKGKKQGAQAQRKNLNGTKRRMIADGFDLFIPGSVTGWLVTTHAFVGFAGAVSTILSSKDIWDRLQG